MLAALVFLRIMMTNVVSHLLQLALCKVYAARVIYQIEGLRNDSRCATPSRDYHAFIVPGLAIRTSQGYLPSQEQCQILMIPLASLHSVSHARVIPMPTKRQTY